MLVLAILLHPLQFRVVLLLYRPSRQLSIAHLCSCSRALGDFFEELCGVPRYSSFFSYLLSASFACPAGPILVASSLSFFEFLIFFCPR